MRISDWSSDVCSSDLEQGGGIDQVVDGLDQKLVMRGGVNGLVEVVVRFDRVRAILAVLQYGAHIVDFDVVGMLGGKACRAAFKYFAQRVDRKSTRLNSSH